MVLGPLIKSALKETIEKLPEDFAMKSESIPNMLVKKGVKAEELKFAKLGLPEGKVTKQDLVQAEVGRQDQWDVTEPDYKRYDYVTLRGQEDNPTYTERVYKWAASPEQALDNKAYGNVGELADIASTPAGDAAEAQLRKVYTDVVGDQADPDADIYTMQKTIQGYTEPGYVSSHFDFDPGYLMHARTIDQDLGDGKKTRTILELQSDLHQQGRQRGYKTADIPKEDLDKMTSLINNYERNPNGRFLDLAGETAEKYGWNPEGEQSIKAFVAQQTGAPKAPLESNWLRKLMEYEVARGVQDGAEQIAIPLRGPATDQLMRGEGVSKWYDTVVKATAEKLAKQVGGTAELIEKSNSLNSADIAELRKTAARIRELRDAVYEGTIDEDELVQAEQEAGQKLASIGRPMPEDEDVYYALQLAADQPKFSADAATYIVIKPGEAAKMQGFQLYASGGASVAALTVANAMNQGVGEDDISTVLKEQGYSDAEIQKALDKGKKAQLALSQGVAEADIRTVLDEQEPQLNQEAEQQPQMQNWQGIKPAYNYLTGETDSSGQAYSYARGNYTPTLQERRDAAYQSITGDKEVSARDLVTSLKVLSPAMVTLTDQASAAFGNSLKAKQVQAAEEAARGKVISLAQSKGLALQWDENQQKYLAQTPDGQWADITPTIWDELWAAKGEATGAVAGAVAGARAGSALPVANPLAKLAVAGAGSAVGAAVGAATGAEADYVYNAIKQSEEMSIQVAAHKAVTAAEWSIIGDVIGYPIAKLGSASIKGIMKAREFLKTGNSAGAYKSLQDTMFISDAEAKELADKLAKVMAVPGSGSKEQAIAATILTKPGAEQTVRAATAGSPRVSQAVLQSIDSRAKDLLTTTETPNVGKLLREDLGNYVSDVKQFFGSVKAEVEANPVAKTVQFDYDKLAVEPLLKRLESNIQDDAVLNRFKNLVMRVRETSDSRTFPDLLELRQIVNGFKYNKRITNTKDFQAIDEVLSNIDGAVDEAANASMPNPQEWLTKFSQARAKYAQMINVQNNVLAKALRKPTLSEQEVGGLLTKHINSLDGTFDTVLSQLPLNARKKAENAVIDTLANKFTTGHSAGLQATDFTQLNEQLENITFTTPEARQMKQAIGRMAEVFKNDPNLARVSGSTSFASPTEFLTADPLVAAKMQSARNMFKSVQKYLPTERGRGLALVNKVAELLENPLHAKTIRDLMDELPEVTPDVQNLQRAYASAKAAGKDVGAARVKLYGTGKVLDVRASSGSLVDAVPIHRIATVEQIKDIAEAEGLTEGKLLDAALKKSGFIAVMQGSNKVRKL